MKIGIISDVHGDIIALKAVLKKLESMEVDKILCAGDLVDRGIHGEQVVTLIHELRIPTVRGNHDSAPFQPQHLSETTMNWLAKLPKYRRFMWHGLTVCLTHGTPEDYWRGVYPYSEHDVHLDAIEEAGTDILITGHTHQPMVTNIFSGQNWIFNPGALYDDGRGKSFAVLTLPEELGDLFAFHVYEVDTWKRLEPAEVVITVPPRGRSS